MEAMAGDSLATVATTASQDILGTSYGWGYREQMVDLLAMGYSEEELDESIPPITVGEYYRIFQQQRFLHVDH